LAFTTVDIPTIPPPPGLLTMAMFALMFFENCSPRVRQKMSVAPPEEKGTTSWMGPFG
jgi:hypothetical protein